MLHTGVAPSGDSLRSQSPGYSENYRKLTYDLIRPPGTFPSQGKARETDCHTSVATLVRNDTQNTIARGMLENQRQIANFQQEETDGTFRIM